MLEGEHTLFTHPAEVVRALRRYRDCYDPRSTSLMAFGGPPDPHAEPFRAGFLQGPQVRAVIHAVRGNLVSGSVARDERDLHVPVAGADDGPGGRAVRGHRERVPGFREEGRRREP